MQQTKKMKWYDFISINLFWLGLNIRNNAFGNVFMPYLVALFVSKNILNTALGEMRTAGLVIAMLVQPAMGLLSDRSTSRFGRRRPFIFIGVILDLIFLAFVALAQNYWALLVAIMLLQFSSNISHGALQALIPDQVPESQRGLASAVKAIFELLPLIILPFTIVRLVSNHQFDLSVLVTGALLLVIMLITMFTVKEEQLKEKPTEKIGPLMLRVVGVLAGILLGGLAGLLAGGIVGGAGGLIARIFTDSRIAWAVGVSIGGAVAMIVAVVVGVWAGAIGALGNEARKNSPFTWWVVNRLLFLAAVTSVRDFANYFIMFAFKIPIEEATQMSANLIMVVGVFTLLAVLPSGWLSDKFGHKRMVAISGVLAVIGSAVLLSTIFVPNLMIMYVAGCILGIATGFFTTTNWALGTQVVPSKEAGRYLGVSNLAGAGAGMIGSGIGGPVADYLNGFLPGMGYFSIFASYAVLFLLSIITLRWVKMVPNKD